MVMLNVLFHHLRKHNLILQPFSVFMSLSNYYSEDVDKCIIIPACIDLQHFANYKKTVINIVHNCYDSMHACMY